MMTADPAALLALICELYANLGRANARIAELEAALAALTGQPSVSDEATVR